MKLYIICRYALVAPIYEPLKSFIMDNGGCLSRDWASEGKHESGWREALKYDIDAIEDAEAVIAFYPGGEDTLIELGAAIGLRKPIHVVIGKYRTDEVASYLQYPEQITRYNAWPVRSDTPVMDDLLHYSMYLTGKKIVAELLNVPMTYETLDEYGNMIENK